MGDRPFDVLYTIFRILQRSGEAEDIRTASLVGRGWREPAQAVNFRIHHEQGDDAPAHFNNVLSKFETNRLLGTYVRELTLSGWSLDVPGGERDGRLATLAATDVARLVATMPFLRALTVRTTRWSGDRVELSTPLPELKRLTLERVEASGARADPMALLYMLSSWEEIRIEDVHWDLEHGTVTTSVVSTQSLVLVFPSIPLLYEIHCPSIEGVERMEVQNLSVATSECLNTVLENCCSTIRRMTICVERDTPVGPIAEWQLYNFSRCVAAEYLSLQIAIDGLSAPHIQRVAKERARQVALLELFFNRLPSALVQLDVDLFIRGWTVDSIKQDIQQVEWRNVYHSVARVKTLRTVRLELHRADSELSPPRWPGIMLKKLKSAFQGFELEHGEHGSNVVVITKLD